MTAAQLRRAWTARRTAWRHYLRDKSHANAMRATDAAHYVIDLCDALRDNK